MKTEIKKLIRLGRLLLGAKLIIWGFDIIGDDMTNRGLMAGVEIAKALLEIDTGYERTKTDAQL